MCRLRWYESLFELRGETKRRERALGGGVGWIGWRSETGEKDWTDGADWLGGFGFEACRAGRAACMRSQLNDMIWT
jgi:hypothetical protein